MARLRINLDIEALLDVRYGWLVNRSPEMRDEILFNFTDYCNRDHDNFWLLFPQIKVSDCEDVTYNLDDLKQSARTNIFTLIDDAVRSMAYTIEHDFELIITLNTRHYQLTEDEIEHFKVLISARFDHQIVVETMSLSLEEMKPELLAAKFDLNIYYDMVGWLAHHWETVAKNPQPRVIFYTPFLFPDKVEGERNFYRVMNEAGLDSPFLETISDALAPYIQIYFESIKYFSPIACR